MRAGSQDDGPARDPGGRPSGRILNDIISVASENNQQSIILHTSIELFAELATPSLTHYQELLHILLELILP
jgi:hypothetical protein